MGNASTPPRGRGKTRARSEASPGLQAHAYARTAGDALDVADPVPRDQMDESVDRASVENASSWPSLAAANALHGARNLPPFHRDRIESPSDSVSSASQADGPPAQPLSESMDSPSMPTIQEQTGSSLTHPTLPSFPLPLGPGQLPAAPHPPLPPIQPHIPDPYQHPPVQPMPPVQVSPWMLDQSSGLWYHIPSGTYADAMGAPAAPPRRTQGSDTVSHHSGVSSLASQLQVRDSVPARARSPPTPSPSHPSPAPIMISDPDHSHQIPNGQHALHPCRAPNGSSSDSGVRANGSLLTSGVRVTLGFALDLRLGLALISLLCATQAPIQGLDPGAPAWQSQTLAQNQAWALEAGARARAILTAAPPPPGVPSHPSPQPEASQQPPPPEAASQQQPPPEQPPPEDEEEKLYFMISRTGNSVRYAREDVEETVTLELEGANDPAIQPRDRLPAIMTGDATGPFKGKAYRRQALALFEQGVLDLFDKEGRAQSFDIFHIDSHGARVFSDKETMDRDDRRANRQTDQANARQDAKADDKRRNVVLFTSLLLHRCELSLAAGELEHERTLISDAVQLACPGPELQKITVHQHTRNGSLQPSLSTYVLFREGTSDEEMAQCGWWRTRYLGIEQGYAPMNGVLPQGIRRRFSLAPCCFRPVLPEGKGWSGEFCPGQEMCEARADAWGAMGYVPADDRGTTRARSEPPLYRESGLEKRQRVQAEQAAEKKAGKERIVQAKLKSLCEDFQAGKVRLTPAHKHVRHSHQSRQRACTVPPGRNLQIQARYADLPASHSLPVCQRWEPLPTGALPLQGPRTTRDECLTRTGERPDKGNHHVRTQMDPEHTRQHVIQPCVPSRNRAWQRSRPRGGETHGLPVQLPRACRLSGRHACGRSAGQRGAPCERGWLLPLQPQLQAREIHRQTAPHVGGDPSGHVHPHSTPHRARGRHARAVQHGENLHSSDSRHQIGATHRESHDRPRHRLNRRRHSSRIHPCRTFRLVSSCVPWHSRNWLALHHRLSWMVESSAGTYA